MILEGSLRAGCIIAAACVTVPTASAHHGNIIFDLQSETTFRGTVTRYDWRNPHVYVFIETQEQGQAVEWQLEGDPIPIMTRSGWSADTLAPGDNVRVRLNPDKNAARRHGLLINLTTPDGTVLEPRSGGRASTVRAASIEGIWDSVRGYGERQIDFGALTQKGREAQATYREELNPVSDCVPYPLPTIVFAPYLSEIEILDDRILIRSEFFDVVRTIWTDGRGHPDDGPLTNQGHSIGWWEGETLVVDTAQFSYYRTGNRNGVPSGTQKHVVERYALSDDRTQLVVRFEIEDPEYMTEPTVGHVIWDYAPDRQLMSIDCDPENAILFEFE
ncbi:MAG TPA: DUF6152 family protein [Gammaproteobacteria bacterium]